MEDMPPPETPITLNEFGKIKSKNQCNYKEYFSCIQGDITQMKSDIIVNSTIISMEPLVGVSKSIHEKCGSALLKYLKKNYYAILPGSYVDSPGFSLKCKKILHVCGPDKNEEQLLSNIYTQCLNYCFNHNYHSITFPCISAGGRGFDEDSASNIVLNTCKIWIDKYHAYWNGKIIFCCYTDKSYEAYKKYFKSIFDMSV